MSSATRSLDCRTFSANIFNKSKCSHCFRQRDEHSAAALECNKVSRKVSKCGYLFVAPDWDFSNPLYRTKRWQRRWFVLYDDGEFIYSVDDHPETVPQACIDMTKVLEVTTAEDVTGHTNSIAITAPDRVTFVKGTCPEESKWWLNILAAFPKSKGRHKRNATFPGGQVTMILQTSPDANTATSTRNRHNSYHKDTLTQSTSVLLDCASVEAVKNSKVDDWKHDDVVVAALDDDNDDGVETVNEEGEGAEGSTKSTGGQDEHYKNAGNEITNRVSVSPACLLIEDIRRDEKTIKDIANTITNLSQQQKSRWSTAAVNKVLNSHLHHANHSNNADETNSRDETDFHRSPMTVTQAQKTSIINLRPNSLPLASNSTPAIVSAIVKKIPPVLVSANSSCSTKGDSNNSNNNVANKFKSSPRLQLQLKHLQQKHQSNQQHRQQQQQKHLQQQHQSHERGDPDGGCNLDDISTNYLAKTAELRVNPPIPVAVGAEESLNSKRGWLMKQDNRTGDWTKYWFTLNGAALFYYRDPVSEERGVLDGVLDVNSLTNVVEVNANKNSAFQLTTWDKRRLTLASLSSNSRNSWIALLRIAAGLPQSPITNITTSHNNSTTTTVIASSNGRMTEPKTSQSAGDLIIKDNTSDDIKREIEKDFIKAQRNHELIFHNFQEPNNNGTLPNSSPQVNITATNILTPKTTVISPTTPPIPKTVHFSSDEEYRTASEGGRRDSIDWGSPLSPPPVPLSLLRVKERMRSRTTNCSRLDKRSQSSPPSSRRSTVDSVGSDELPIIHPVQEELHIDKELQFRLSVAEKEGNMLRDEAKGREARMSELLSTLERTEQQLNSRIQEMEDVRKILTTQLVEAKQNAEEIINRLTDELEESQTKIKYLEDRLTSGIDDNEILYKRLREMESCSPSSFSYLNRTKFKRMDSLSDLTQISDIDPYCLERDSLAEEYNELRSRFVKAVNEIKAMKRELKESQNQFDSLEITYASLKQDLECKEIEDRSQLQMMAERIQDLTLKYSSSERQVRTLKQKLAKSERRRSLSLKGKEQLTISKELEIKLSELETKIDEVEKSTLQVKYTAVAANRLNKPISKKSSRRRSLESSASADSLQFMVRVNELEKRCDGVTILNSVSSLYTPSPSSNTPTFDGGGISTRNLPTSNAKLSEHLLERLRCLEGVLIASKDRLEQSLDQLQNIRSPRTRRSVSPNTDRKDSYRSVERCLVEVVKLIRESCETCVITGTVNTVEPSVILLPESNPVKIALIQLETQLRNKLADLLKQRRVLRERNELTKRKDLELLAERVAFESVCFGKLRESVTRAEHPELFGKRQTRAEVAETSHLITMLKAKLSGKCALKPSGSLDILAGVLARRLVLSTYHKDVQCSAEAALEPVEKNILDDLLRQQNEVNAIAKRYKNHAMENLATGLAAETLSYISTNDLVQGAVQEAWRQAQETVNAELVQSEIAHIMMCNAERFENSISPSFGYTLTAQERVSFEKFADAVHETLRKEMELAVTQLTQCYEEAMLKMKRGQWRLHLEQERKASEGRQLLSEFADIIAHKALVDARIAVLGGEYASPLSTSSLQSESQPYAVKIGITTLQKYENLFEELSNDLQINSPDDILAEADFEFMYKQHTVDFLVNDRQVLSDISTFLSQLEDSLIALHCEAASTTSISRSAISIESLQDVCHKCCDLRHRADQLLQEVHRKLKAPCQHCIQVRDKLCSLQHQHETEMLCLQQSHAKDINILMQQVEKQRNALHSLEVEKNAVHDDLHKSGELIEDRERKLNDISEKLIAKEEQLRFKQNDQLELLQRLDDQEEKLCSYQEESEALTMKCARQDEDYAVMLQERDYLQAELGKEKERSRRFEKRQEMLELEHSKQLECLQEAYRDQLLSHCSDFSNVTDEDSFRERYQSEIEQLKTLCEKGLSTMESSHRRIINDLKQKHRLEIERLLIEKETALAEETQATLAALDAMRKAHQSEVQREVANFKQEFFRQMQRGEHSLDTVKSKEEELEELRLEILSFSEKYSIKCVENAALEEKLRSANQKLKNFQQMQQIELRNKQFRAHLASENPTTDANFVQGLLSSKDDGTCQDSEPSSHASTDLTKSSGIQTALQPNDVPNQEQRLIVISSRSRQSATEAVAITANADDDDEDGGVNAMNCRYLYEPCYQQTNLYSYQKRTNFEGLKFPTFGKNLKLSTTDKSVVAAATATTTSSTSSNTTKSSSTSSAIHSSNFANEIQKMLQNQDQQKHLFKTATSINMNNNSRITANEQKMHSKNNHSNYYQQYLQKQKQKCKSDLLTTTKPVMQPKNFSATTCNLNGYNLNYQQHKELDSNLNKNLNNNSNAKLTNRTTQTTTNLKIAERSAINLESFTNIIKKTTSAAATDDVDDEQIQQRPQH